MPGPRVGCVRFVIELLESRTLLTTPSSSPVDQLAAVPFTDVAPFVTNTVPKGYTPAQMRHAYGFDQITLGDGATLAKGRGQTIAIVGAFSNPSIREDLATFSSQWGLPQMDGQAGRPRFSIVQMSSSITTSEGWGVEMALDVQWAHAIAPKANIVLVEATNNSLGALLAAVDVARNMRGVSVVSMSWGTNDFPSEWSYDRHFTTPPGHNGVTFVAASGDNGSPVSWPAVSRKVIAVGGTTLQIDADGNYLSETAWSGSGGGISSYQPVPAYQTNGYTMRTSPDIAYDADPATGVPVYDSFGYSGRSGWFTVGGTSIGAPQIAGLIAIADQLRQADGKMRLYGRAQALPAIYSAPASVFHDVVTGTTSGVITISATTGYDLATGFGSPYADRFSNMLLLA